MRNEIKREFIRLKAYHLVKYRLLTEKGASSERVLASIKDIGAGGVCLKVEEYLPVATLLEVDINFPQINTSLSALVKIVWVKQIKRTKRYEIGAQFVEIKTGMKELIDQKVKNVHFLTKHASVLEAF
ncbi:MAG TPA: PilZ domain-containing protein [Candidatus Omnitrophota bacterium]|nr:PilZ domain-containing protein [Candidatus Omnitrophota bacterium]HPT06703.1 PilZ domain-containing protein [Candidatus Omnitrophota bacterium]